MSDVIHVNSLSLMKAAFLPSFPKCKRFIVLKAYLAYTAEDKFSSSCGASRSRYECYISL